MRTQLVLALLSVLWSVTPMAIASEVDDSVRQIQTKLQEEEGLTGSVCMIVGPDGVLKTHLFGLRNNAPETPMTEDTVFWVASQTKSVTAIAFMMLVDEGKVSLDKPIETYLPEFAGWSVKKTAKDGTVTFVQPKKKVTPRLLLMHRSGMVEGGIPLDRQQEIAKFNEAYLKKVEKEEAEKWGEPMSLAEACAECRRYPLIYEPGEKYNYSNRALDIVARVIEVVSGTPYEEFLQERIFNPLEMKDTTFRPTAKQLAKAAICFRFDEKKKVFKKEASRKPYPPGKRIRAGAGLYSTAQDFANFSQMLLNKGVYKGKRLVSEKAVLEMRNTGTGKTTGYGLAMQVQGEGVFGHGGALTTQYFVHSKQGYAFVWMCHAGWDVSHKAAELVRKAAIREFNFPK